MPIVLKKKTVWVLFASFVILAWVSQMAYRGFFQKPEPDLYSVLNEGDVLPAQTPIVGADGKLFQMEQFRGKVVLLNFWAGWCGPCLKEMPSLYQLQKVYQSRGFEILAISLDEDLGQGMEVLKRVAGTPPFPVFKGTEQAIYHRFPIEGLPFTAVVDKAGVIRYARPGERNWMQEDARKMIEALL